MPVFDVHQNLAISAVATAPSPATSGTSLVVTAAQGARFPTPPFNAVIWPTASQPDPSNAEVVRVTAIATDTLTITRAQEGTSARTVVVTDQIAAAITAKTLTDVESLLNAQQRTLINPAAVSMVTVPGVMPCGTATSQSYNINQDHYYPVFCEDTVTFDEVLVGVTTASGSAGSIGRIAIYNATPSWQPTGTLIEEFPSVATDATGNKTSTPAGGSRKLPPGRYVIGFNCNGAAVTLQAYPGNVGMFVSAGLGGSPYAQKGFRVPRTNAAFPSTGTTWTTFDFNANGTNYAIFLRVTAVGT